MPRASSITTIHCWALATPERKLFSEYCPWLDSVDNFIGFPSYEAAERGRDAIQKRLAVYGLEVVYIGEEEPETASERRERQDAERRAIAEEQHNEQMMQAMRGVA